ncbi:MAG: hypothetical protein V4773_18170 [Verrucomicrobiota bacterium]
MSDNPAHSPRPVSLVSIIFVFALFAAALLLVKFFYHPTTSAAFNFTAENYPKEKDAEWKSNSQTRAKGLADLKAEQAKQLTSYGWADKNAGKVHLPIDRAMELTAQQYGAKK